MLGGLGQAYHPGLGPVLVPAAAQPVAMRWGAASRPAWAP